MEQNSENATLKRALALPRGDRERGEVVLVVVRPSRGERLLPEAIEMTVEGGVEGDRWGKRSHRDHGRQVSAVNGATLACLAGEAPVHLSGDNLHLTIDISKENLPTGSLIRVDDAVLRVLPTLHDPCDQFERRFGRESYLAANSDELMELRGRGVMLEVVEGGRVAIGGSVEVISRGSHS